MAEIIPKKRKAYQSESGFSESRRNFSGSKKELTVGNLVYKDRTLSGSEIIFDYNVELIEDRSLSESDIDSKAVSTLDGLNWKEHEEIRQSKTNIPEIDDHLKSKTGSDKKGHADIYLLTDNKLKVIIDNKNPKESVEKGIEDAIFYAKCLLEKDYDIRIVMSYNGNECALRVFDSESEEWVPFSIDGKEINAFPSREMVEIIYKYRDINNIIITEDFDSINISNVIQGLKEIYRNIPHIQNDNQKALDFTISFIALKSILEKHGSQLGKNWSDLDVSEQKKLKEKINTYVEDIIESLENGYGEIFKIKEDSKGKIKAFDFLGAINQFPSKVEKGEKGHLVQIFEKLNELPHLHSSKFDLFGEVYQFLMSPDTRKIFGQFFTPRHIIKTLVRLFYEEEIDKIVGEIKNGKAINPKTICDPAVGTGGFLTETFKYLATNAVDVDSIDLAKRCIYGFDIYPANAVRSRINMYLAGDGFSQIDAFDSLKYKEKQFDYIITNPPFGAGDFSVDKSIFSSRRKEDNFLIKIVNLIKKDGRALLVVPDGILESTNRSELRKWLICNCVVEKIVGLPKHMFAPYTHEKTYVLFIKKRTKPIENLEHIKTERIWMYIIDCDGYANADRRFRTDKTDSENKWLHDELSLWRDHRGVFHTSLLEDCWKRKTQSSDEVYTDEWGAPKEGLKYGYVEMETIISEEYTSSKKGKIKTRKPMNLLPEKHLRPAKVEKVKFSDFKEDNKKLIQEIKGDFENLFKGL